MDVVLLVALKEESYYTIRACIYVSMSVMLLGKCEIFSAAIEDRHLRFFSEDSVYLCASTIYINLSVCLSVMLKNTKKVMLMLLRVTVKCSW